MALVDTKEKKREKNGSFLSPAHNVYRLPSVAFAFVVVLAVGMAQFCWQLFSRIVCLAAASVLG